MRQAIIILLLTAVWTTGSAAYAQPWYETYTGWAVSTEPVLPDQERHPSIWFDQDDIEALRSRPTADSYTAQMWFVIQQEIARYRDMSIASTTMSTRPIMAKVLAFAWIMNEDETARDRAVDVLLTAYDNVPREVPNDGDHRLIYRAPWLQNYLAAYDWVQPELTPEQDEEIRSRLIEEAQLIRNNLVEGIVYAPRPHNHRSKPAYALASAAVTLSDHEAAADWLEHALEQSNTVTRYQFSFDGIYREGGHYHVYTMVNLVPFLWHYRNVSGVDLFEDFAPAFEWPVWIRLQRGSMPNIEDSFIKPMPTHMVAAAYRDTPTQLHSSAPLSDVLQWNWRNTLVVPQNYTGATNDVIWEIDELITYDPDLPSVAPDVSPTIMLESGQIAFRNAWDAPEGEGRYLLFHGVASADNHNHPDNLSYFVESHGALLAVDAGYGASGFSDSNRDWFTSAEAHNIVTVNTAAPGDFDFNVGPTITHFLTSPHYAFAEMEARLPFRSGNTTRRGIAFPNRSFWVVYDLMYADGEVDYRLNVHGRATRTNDITQNGNRITWTTPSTWGAPARLHTFILATDPDPTITMERGAASLAWGHAEPQHYAQVYQRADTAAFMHLLYPSGASDPFPDVSDLSSGNTLAFEIDDEATSSIFLAQARNDLSSAGRLSTDASFGWMETADETPTATAMTRATNLRLDGTPIVVSEAPLTYSATFSGGSIDAITVVDVEEPVTLTVWPASGATVSSITRDGTAVSFDRGDGGAVTFEVDADGVYIFLTSVAAARPGVGSSRLRIEAYPNPFSTATSLRYEVPEAGRVVIRVYNVLGQLVATLLDGNRPAGIHEIDWMPGSSAVPTPRGVYVVEVRANGSTSTATAVMIP